MIAPSLLLLSAIADWISEEQTVFLAIHVLGISAFVYIVARRIQPLLQAQSDYRTDRPFVRLGRVFKYWFGQWKHPRYAGAGVLHIVIFTGFILLAARAFSLLTIGMFPHFVMPVLSGRIYETLTDYAATIVFLCMIIAMARRLFFQPVRYAVPAQCGKGRSADAIFLLGLIALLMAADSLFAGSSAALTARVNGAMAAPGIPVASVDV